MAYKGIGFARIRNVVEVPFLPECDFCRAVHDNPANHLQRYEVPKAHYDIRTKFGHWANACRIHYENYGTGLGPGRGQMMVVMEKEKAK